MTEKNVRMDNMGRAVTELLGECVVARRKVNIVGNELREMLVKGAVDYQAGMAAIREVREMGRYLTAQAVQIENDIQPPLPGLGLGDTPSAGDSPN